MADVKNVKVKLVQVTNFERTFGSTDYIIFDAVTESNFPLSVAISHTALRRANVELGLADSLVNSTVIVKDSADIKTGLVITAEEKLNRIINQEINPTTQKPYSMILCSSSLDFSLLKSEQYLAESKDIISATNAKVVIEKEKERKINAMKRASDRLRNAIGTPEQKKEPVLETNTEDVPF